MITATKLKEYIKSKGLYCSSDLVDKVEQDLEVLIDRAIERATESGNKTLMPRHL